MAGAARLVPNREDHMRRLLRGRAAAALVTAACVGAGTLATSVAGPAAAREGRGDRGHDTTSAIEARRVDRVRLGPITFRRCTFLPATEPARCGVVAVPLDYDRPDGPKVRLQVARVRATNPQKRIGVLFVNPGGPGGSAVDLATFAPQFLDRRILERFDVVGVEPRGIGRGDRIQCFTTGAAADAARAGRQVRFPVGTAQESAWLTSSRKIATACSTTGRPLTASASTAEVARDMDVVRRALGEQKLTFFGLSYGTQLGQVYANLFPDRVRAVVVDGVLDPVAWTTGRGGSGRTRPVTYRLRSGEAGYRALREYLARCDAAGAPACPFASARPAARRFDALARRLREQPVRLDDPRIGTFDLDYAGLVSEALTTLYGLSTPGVDLEFARFLTAADAASATPAAATPARRAGLARAAGRRLADLRDAVRATWAPAATSADPDYVNDDDVFAAVLCSDSRNPRDPLAWRRAAAAADRRAPYFGRLWTWASAECAGRYWTARDEDRYLGPFTRRTAAPLLFVGNYYDPATPYLDGAVPAARLAPNSRLLTSDSWGHTAYGTSDCVTDAIVGYLVAGTLPAKGTVCVGYQPFTATASPLAARSGATGTRPAPITPVLPGPFGG